MILPNILDVAKVAVRAAKIHEQSWAYARTEFRYGRHMVDINEAINAAVAEAGNPDWPPAVHVLIYYLAARGEGLEYCERLLSEVHSATQ